MVQMVRHETTWYTRKYQYHDAQLIAHLYLKRLLYFLREAPRRRQGEHLLKRISGRYYIYMRPIPPH